MDSQFGEIYFIAALMYEHGSSAVRKVQWHGMRLTRETFLGRYDLTLQLMCASSHGVDKQSVMATSGVNMYLLYTCVFPYVS